MLEYTKEENEQDVITAMNQSESGQHSLQYS